MFSASNPKFLYAKSTTDLTAFSADMSDGAGGPWLPHMNDQPYLTLNIPHCALRRGLVRRRISPPPF